MEYFPLKIPIKLKDCKVFEENSQHVSQEEQNRRQRWAEVVHKSGLRWAAEKGALAEQGAVLSTWMRDCGRASGALTGSREAFFGGAGRKSGGNL